MFLAGLSCSVLVLVVIQAEVGIVNVAHFLVGLMEGPRRADKRP